MGVLKDLLLVCESVIDKLKRGVQERRGFARPLQIVPFPWYGTPDSLEIDWSNTFYVYAGKKEGGFWFEGIPYKDKKKPVPPDTITGVIFTKEIYPEKLITLSQLAGAYVHEEMKSGENGVQLTVKVDGKPITETLTLKFSDK